MAVKRAAPYSPRTCDLISISLRWVKAVALKCWYMNARWAASLPDKAANRRGQSRKLFYEQICWTDCLTAMVNDRIRDSTHLYVR